ncbi:GNAT family N-acetyltransferase [Chloroflexota bacterium]
MGIKIKLLEEKEIAVLLEAFENTVWNDPASLYLRYLVEQQRGERTVLAAYADSDFTGYVTIKWQSDYPPFTEKEIPEINDLRVLPDFRRRGIATALVDRAEELIFERSDISGIGVGLYADYGAAQCMYILRGYVPDGLGIFYKGQHVKPGQKVPVDDDLILYLMKAHIKVIR